MCNARDQSSDALLVTGGIVDDAHAPGAVVVGSDVRQRALAFDLGVWREHQHPTAAATPTRGGTPSDGALRHIYIYTYVHIDMDIGDFFGTHVSPVQPGSHSHAPSTQSPSKLQSAAPPQPAAEAGTGASNVTSAASATRGRAEVVVMVRGCDRQLQKPRGKSVAGRTTGGQAHSKGVVRQGRGASVAEAFTLDDQGWGG